MLGIAFIAWIAALAFAVVVLAFCSYEVSWKARRLRTDLTKLQSVAGRLQGLQSDVEAVQRRLAASASGSGSGTASGSASGSASGTDAG